MNSWDLKPLAENHTKFIVELLKTTQGVTIETCDYLCTKVFLHAWKHCEENMEPRRGRNGKFLPKR